MRFQLGIWPKDFSKHSSGRRGQNELDEQEWLKREDSQKTTEAMWLQNDKAWASTIWGLYLIILWYKHTLIWSLSWFLAESFQDTWNIQKDRGDRSVFFIFTGSSFQLYLNLSWWRGIESTLWLGGWNFQSHLTRLLPLGKTEGLETEFDQQWPVI